MLYSFNPVTGEPITAPPVRLSYKIDQAMMLPHMRDGDFLKPILLLDTLRQVTTILFILPSSIVGAFCPITILIGGGLDPHHSPTPNPY